MPGVGVAPDLRARSVGVGQADVGDAVRGQDDPVDAVLGERLAGELVAEAQAGLEVRRSAGVQPVDDASRISVGVARTGRLKDHARVAAERHDGDRVVAAELVDQDPQRVLHELEPTPLLHRPRGVDDERQRGVGTRPIAHVTRGDADAQQDLVASVNGVGPPSATTAKVVSRGGG